MRKRRLGTCLSAFHSENYVYMCEHISIIPECLHIYGEGRRTKDAGRRTCLFGFTFGLVPFMPQRRPRLRGACGRVHNLFLGN